MGKHGLTHTEDEKMLGSTRTKCGFHGKNDGEPVYIVVIVDIMGYSMISYPGYNEIHSRSQQYDSHGV